MSTAVKVVYNGSGTTGPFTFPTVVAAQADLVAIHVDEDDVATTLTYSTDYTIDDLGNKNGVTVNLVDTLAVGEKLFLIFDPEYVQDSQFSGATRIPTYALDSEFSRLYAVTRLLQNAMSRAMAFAEPWLVGDFDPTLPRTLFGAVGRVLKTNSSGTGFELGPTADQIESAQAYAEAAEESASEAASYSITPVEFTFTNNQSATNVTGETYASTAKRAVFYEMFVVRGSLISVYRFFVGFNDTAYFLVNQGFDGDDCGLTWTITGTTTYQLQLASTNATNGGTVYGKKRFIDI